jgi:hypothetical protein
LKSPTLINDGSKPPLLAKHSDKTQLQKTNTNPCFRVPATVEIRHDDAVFAFGRMSNLSALLVAAFQRITFPTHPPRPSDR